MLTKNLTPFLIGTKLTSRRPPDPEMTIVVKGTFTFTPGEPLAPVTDFIAQGSLTAETFHEHDDERAGECLYPGDFADFKLNSEILVKAHCHAPRGVPVTECPVQVRLGAWSKALRVTGRRTWREGGRSATEPEPFTTLAITWANAFGGPGHEHNPAGKGVGTDELPNVLAGSDVLDARSDRLSPAGLGPVNPAWPARASKMGRAYGRAWRERRAPFFAEDFDWSYFSAAPPDQQLAGYLKGDETVAFQNLHPRAPFAEARLPGLRVRAFVKDRTGKLTEPPMSLDTVYADLDGGTIALTWRGVVPVREMDLADVRTLLVASEPLAGDPLTEAHYRAAIEAFEADAFGLGASTPFTDDAAPGGAPDTDPVSAILERRFGKLPAEIKARVQAMMAAAQKDASPHRDVADEIRKVLAAADDTPPRPVPREPGALPDLGLRRAMRGVMAQVADLKRRYEGQPVTPAQRAKLDEIERVPFDERWRALDPDYTPPVEPLSTDEPGPGRDLAERDFTGADLRGADLRGADLTSATLTRADLAGADLRGAKLAKAILFRTNLEGANLAGADLTRANAAQARLASADLTGATLDQAFFEDASLRGATLASARGAYAVFTRADLSGVKASRVALPHADLEGASIEGADLTGAELSSCLFARCRAAAVDMTGATLRGSSFVDARLPGAQLGLVQAEGSYWTRAVLDGADLRLAGLRSAHLTEVSAEGAYLYGANLREARLDRARLDRADLTRANLFEADLSRASLAGTRLASANLYEARLLGASGGRTDLAGATLTNTMLERP